MKIVAYKFIDKLFGIPLCLILGLLSKVIIKKDRAFKNILIIKLWALGDSVVLLPTLKAIRQKYPEARIDVLSKNRNKSIFEMSKDLNSLILFEFPNLFKLFFEFNKYDVIIDTEPYLNISALISWYLGVRRIGFANQTRSIIYTDKIILRKDQHMVQNYLDMVRIIDANYEEENLVKLYVDDNNKNLALNFLENNNINKKDLLIGICTATAESASKTRVWSNEKFVSLCDTLIDNYNAKIIFFGAASEKNKIEEIQKLMRNESINNCSISLKPSVYLMELCKIFISVDTGPMHIAAAQGVKTIGLFGPNTPKLWAPYGKGNISIYKNVECSPCIINDKGYMPDCLRKTDRYLCMNLISVDKIIKEVERIVNDNK